MAFGTLVRGVFVTGVAVAMLIVTYPVAFWFENRRYAGHVFDEVVAYSEVMASSRWDSVIDGFGCSYAVVRLAPDATTFPPTAARRKGDPRYDPFLDFAGEWSMTPTDALSDRSGDGPWIFCRLVMEKQLFDELDAALRSAGGWWRGSYDTIFFYSSRSRLAFRLWQGD